MTRLPQSIVLYEPDAWRYSGIARFLGESGVAVLAGSFVPHEAAASPDAVMLAHALVTQYGPEIVGRVRRAHPLIGILVHGETECLTTTASLLALGVQGYFMLSAPQPRLLDALAVVMDGGFWAPRAAVAMLAQRTADVPRDDPEEDGDRSTSTRPARTARSTAAGASSPMRFTYRLVLALLLEGLSNKEIAARLGVAEVTVKARLTRLYKRHGVKTRLQLLSAAIRQHLIATGL